jgi:hypothetical protein
LLLRNAREVERVHELAFGLPDVKRRCPRVMGESGGSCGRFEDGADQALELAVHGGVAEWFPKTDKSGHRTQLLPVELRFII